MIDADAIRQLVALLQNRGVYLWHACQLRDFKSYLALGGIPSRAFLESSGSAFTAFATDSTDRNNSVWDKVFVNLSDFGRTFAKGYSAVPNPYGPIVLRISPTALLEASDVAVCLRSAGGWRFDRHKEALKSIEEIDFLFEYPAHEGFPRSSFVKFRQKLQEKYPTAQDPEISCTVQSGRFSIHHANIAYVDPYNFSEKSLFEYVKAIQGHYNAKFRVYERSCDDVSRYMLYNELATVIASGISDLNDLAYNEAISQNLSSWSRSIVKLDWQFKRFANYLREGTLLPIMTSESHVKINDL